MPHKIKQNIIAGGTCYAAYPDGYCFICIFCNCFDFFNCPFGYSADAGDGEAADELHVISGHLMFYQYDW